MSDGYNEDFDTLFDPTNSSDSGSLTATDVQRIATNTFMRGLQALEQGAAKVQQLKSDAMRQTEAAHPGFIERIHDSRSLPKIHRGEARYCSRNTHCRSRHGHRIAT